MAPTSSKIALTREPQALVPLDGVNTATVAARHLGAKSNAKSTVPIINYKSAAYQAEVLVNGHKFVVFVDTGSSDFWLSCAFVADFGCSSTCPYSAKVLMYGSGNACVVPVTGTLQVGDLVLQDYIISVGQGRNMVPNTKESLLPPTAQGLFGLAYASLAKIPNTQAGQFIDHVDNFSIYLTEAANSTGSFLMLNGVDTELIAKEKLTPLTVPVVSKPNYWTIGMTAFQAGDDTVQFPCSRTSASHVLAADPTRCDSIVDTGTSMLLMPESVFRAFVRQHLVPQGCRDARSLVVGVTKELYFCPDRVALPRLSFTFDDATFYLRAEDYVMPVPGAPLVMVELQSSGFSSDSWILGDTFLKRFYASYEVNRAITFYCRAGDCARGVVVNPVQPQQRTPAPTPTPTDSVSGPTASSDGAMGVSGGDSAATSSTDASSSSSNTVTILAVVLALVGAALLVGAFLFVRARKRRTVAAAAAASAQLTEPSPAAAVASTPTSTNAFYAAPASTPLEAHV